MQIFTLIIGLLVLIAASFAVYERIMIDKYVDVPWPSGASKPAELTERVQNLNATAIPGLMLAFALLLLAAINSVPPEFDVLWVFVLVGLFVLFVSAARVNVTKARALRARLDKVYEKVDDQLVLKFSRFGSS